MKILKSFEIAITDKRTIEITGIPSLVLMESAGRSAVQIILQHYPNLEKITVVAGSGNNGGDAVVVARYLAKLGKEVYLFILAENESKLSPDNLKNLEIFKNFGFTYQFITDKNLDTLEKNLVQTDLIVDGIFGTGFKPPVKSFRENVIKLINQSKKPVVSIDIPSGLSADTGNVEGEVVKADITITFGYPKICHILYPALQYCGKVYVADISLNPVYAEVGRYLITPENLTLPVREKQVINTPLVMCWLLAVALENQGPL
jgi:yjeF N-terminal region